MNKREFKEYIEKDLDRDKFEEVSLKKVRQFYEENGNKNKELKESQEREILKQLWDGFIESAYQRIKAQVKSNNIEAWKLKIEDTSLIELANNSFKEY